MVCDEAKLDEKGCLGAPDIVVEIISLATARKDLGLKFDLYESCGVLEYWVVFPQERAIQVYKLMLPANTSQWATTGRKVF